MSNKGLTTAEALERAKQGKNVLTQGKKKSLFSVIAEQFASPLLLLLVAASVISIMTGEIVDGIIIIVVVLANVIIGTVQELSAEKSVEALRQINASTAVVIRDGVETEIPASELVVDDYVILEAGRVVPADLALVQTSSLKVNESALTGESVAVEKDCSETSDEKTPLGDRKDKVSCPPWWNTAAARVWWKRSAIIPRSARFPACCIRLRSRRRRCRKIWTASPRCWASRAWSCAL